ncbi:MAG: alpha-hydroxy-acid oxidizing protein [Sphingomonadaceae bacterium]|nr:alpha-hydroxy-acid oxidizing protein [Sphingomonadaceae bacterium]
MKLSQCHNIDDFRLLAKKRLPWPVFDYIDGAADDEATRARNTAAYADCDLVPNVLAGVEHIDTSVTIMGRKSALPLILSPTALQRVFHWQGERAVARAAQKFGLWCGISSLATVSIEVIGAMISTPKMFQLYVHKDKGLNKSMIERCKAAKFDALALTVDTIVGGKRERCLRSGFSSPPTFTPSSFISYGIKPRWALDYLFREKFALPNLDTHVREGTAESVSIQKYFSEMLDQSMDWKMVEQIRDEWGGTFCLKGVMSVEDARRAADMGIDAIMISNHGGRQLDGSRSPFDQLPEIVDAVGGRIEIICDGGVRRGTHILKSLAAGADCASGGRLYLYALAAAGQAGVERAIQTLKEEIERGMKLMGVTSIDQLSGDKLRWR